MGQTKTTLTERNQRKRPLEFVISFSCVAILLGVSVFINETVNRFPHEPLSPNIIKVLELDNNERLRRRRVSDPHLTLEDQFTLPKDRVRQFSYLFTLESSETPEQTVIIPEISGTVQAFVNGISIGTERARPYLLLGEKPGYIDLKIPNSLFQTGNNRIEFIVTPDKWGASLSDIYILAEDSSDAAAHGVSNFKLIRVVWLISAGIFLIGIILGVTLQKKWRKYIIFGVAGSALIAKSALSPSLALPAGLSPLTIAIALDIVLAACVLILILKSQTMSALSRGLGLAAILALVLTAYSLISLSNGVELNPILPFMALGVLPFFGMKLFKNVQEDYAASKLSKEELLSKLSAAEKTIADQRTSLDKEIKRSAKMEERQRLTRDIHDGIGGHLLSLLVRVKSGTVNAADIESELQYGLNDLRLIVDSMDHSSDDLESALKTFKARARPQLTASGVALEWVISSPFMPGKYGPKTVLNVYRFMQEAITNTVRHSGANKLRIELSCDDPQEPFRIYIADNGAGMAQASEKASGQGLKNMRARAKQLGATLSKDVGLDGKGLSYSLVIPAAKQT